MITKKSITTTIKSIEYNIYDEKASVIGCKLNNDVIIPDIILYENHPYEVNSIANEAFVDSDITSIRIGKNVTSIGNNCFYNCKKLKLIELPISITHIGRHAFVNCSSLKSFIIPPNLDEKPSLCFNGCTNLQEILFPYESYKIEDIYVDGCKKLCEETMEHIIITEAGLRLAKEKRLFTRLKKHLKKGALFSFEVLMTGSDIVDVIVWLLLLWVPYIIIQVTMDLCLYMIGNLLTMIWPLLIIGLLIFVVYLIFTDR